jgi:NADPH:quinone reductase-like Zn-dependent oxidoreductase
MPVVWQGLSEFESALRELPTTVRSEAQPIVSDAANATASHVKAAYERVRTSGTSGRKAAGKHLADGVKVVVDNGGTSYARAFMRSTAKHSHLYEFGSVKRQWKSGKNTGTMPAQPTVIPAAERERRKMRDELVEMMRRNGLEVSGV